MSDWKRRQKDVDAAAGILVGTLIGLTIVAVLFWVVYIW